MDAGLLILRLVIGGIMAAHGAQKLFGWFGGYGLAGTGGWLESMGFRPGRVQAAVNDLSEFGGGLFLATGLLTPLASAAIVGVMLVAIVAVHLKSGFWNPNGGYEFNLVLIAGALALAFTGPGAASLDRAFDLDLDGINWGFVAAALAAAGAGISLALRRPEPTPVSAGDPTAA